MPHKKRVLLVSKDLTLLQTRKLMLGAYFDVNAAARVIEAAKILEEQAFDLIILCSTLTDADCEEIMHKALERYPKIKILILTVSALDVPREKASVQLRPEHGPFMLIKQSAEVLGLTWSANGRSVLQSNPSHAVPSGGR